MRLLIELWRKLDRFQLLKIKTKQKKTYLWESSSELRDGTLRDPSPVLNAIFAEGEVVRWICCRLTPHDASADETDE